MPRSNRSVGGRTVESMDLPAVVETRPGVRRGKPCFIGTRIAVDDVLEHLASGMTTEEIVADFPELTPEHVRAAIEVAALRERRLATAWSSGSSRTRHDTSSGRQRPAPQPPRAISSDDLDVPETWIAAT